jgi:hypothetical protein
LRPGGAEHEQESQPVFCSPSSPSTEAVAWAAGAFDVVATFFVLLAVVIWARPRLTRSRTIALVFCCLGGVLSKESAIVIPVLLGLIAALTRFNEGLEVRRRVWALTACAATVGSVFVARALLSPAIGGHLANLPAHRRALKDLIVRPFASLAVPVRTDAGITLEAWLLGVAILITLAGVLSQRISRASAADIVPPRSNNLAVLGFGAA